MSRWVFYSAPGTCALATHIALHEAGADFDVVKLDFGANQQQSPEFLRVNPKGRVPALVTEQGALTETPALLAFVAQSFPDAKLAPVNDPAIRHDHFKIKRIIIRQAEEETLGTLPHAYCSGKFLNGKQRVFSTEPCHCTLKS